MAKKEFDKRDYHQELTDKLIASIESAQKLNWEKPWFSAPSTRPFNLETGTRYSGCNLMATALSGFEDPRWLTFRGISSYAQKKDIELQLRKGSKGTPIFKAFAKEITEDKNGVPLDKPRKIIFMAYAGTVFNGEQIEGMPEYTKQQNREIDSLFAGEELKSSLIERTNLKVIESPRGAWYRPGDHTVGMPKQSTFKTDLGYYDTQLHEFGHSTGPALGRKMEGVHGGQDYAYEELIAELSSCFMAAEIGLQHNQYSHDQHAAYLQSWLKALNDDKNFIFKASNAASRASNFQMEHLREHLYELNAQHTATPEQNNLLESLGVPERILKQIQNQEAGEKLQARTEKISEPDQQVAPSFEEGSTAHTPIPLVIAPKRRQTQSRGMRM
jgi:antirestriction protein ArdC